VATKSHTTLIDTHAHLAYPQLSDGIDHYLQLAQTAGVSGILCVATTAADSRKCTELAEQHPMIRAAVGIHPNNCHEATDDDWQSIQRLAKHPRVVALGETGLDRYWDDCPWETQLDYLRRHIHLARETDLPIVIHTRDCVDEAVEILIAEYAVGPFAAVMHSFTGSLEAAERCLSIGFYISFAGMLTFKNSEEIRSVARRIPLDRLLVETDSPYLTPHPFRGQRPNHPALVRHTLDCLAEQTQQSPADLSRIVTENSLRLFHRWNA
jgi:TatD DNase family protein